MDKIPTLFHIGTQRAGSTYLYNMLKSHQGISLSKLGEVNYYTRYFDKGDGWYLESFEGDGVKIDTSPKYFMLGETAAQRIREHVQGEPKFLLMVRNPIDYVYSHFRMHHNQRYFKRNPDLYPTCSNDVLEFLKMYPAYLDRGKYAEILETFWLEHFDISRFHIVLFEDFIADSKSVAKGILRFWGLSEQDLEPVGVSKNKAVRHPILHTVRNKVIQHEGLKKALKNSKMFNYVYDKHLTEKSGKPLSDTARAAIQGKLKDDVARFGKLTNIDLGVWQDFHDNG